MTSAPPRLTVRAERWPIAGRFAIARGSKTEANVVVAELEDGHHIGRGECVPYARYGETVDSVAAAIEALSQPIATGLDRAELQKVLPAGAARNALDCALWDLEAKRTGKRVWEIAGVAPPKPVTTAYTISLDTPEAMAATARQARFPLLKLKLGAPGDPERLRAVRAAVPEATLIVDANEGWRADDLTENVAACADTGVQLIEQPLPARDDNVLASISRPVTMCADESVHTRADLASLRGKYDVVNVKLDKTGGLTEALALVDDAARAGFGIMIGSMVSTSLAVAPALVLAARARFVDLDGPLLLARDRPEALRYDRALLQPPTKMLWG